MRIEEKKERKRRKRKERRVVNRSRRHIPQQPQKDVCCFPSGCRYHWFFMIFSCFELVHTLTICQGNQYTDYL